jgi:hypothetical protein
MIRDAIEAVSIDKDNYFALDIRTKTTEEVVADIESRHKAA